MLKRLARLLRWILKNESPAYIRSKHPPAGMSKPAPPPPPPERKDNTYTIKIK